MKLRSDSLNLPTELMTEMTFVLETLIFIISFKKEIPEKELFECMSHVTSLSVSH